MTTYVPEALRRKIVERANDRCEYCLVHQDDRFFAHEIDHVRAEKHQGQTAEDNLSLACAECNRFKGSDLCSFDIVTDTVVPLYHPRLNRWTEHFRLNGALIEPLTPAGRVTAFLLHLNDADTIDRRRLLIATGRYPRF